MKIEYRFENAGKAMFAEEVLKGQQIFATVNYFVLPEGSIEVVHYLQVEDKNAMRAQDVLTQFNLMGKKVR